MKLPGPWSYSSLNQYVTCGAQYEALRVSKRFPREESEASIWGTEVHKAIELYLTQAEPLPERMQQFQSYVDSLVDDSGRTEIFVELELGVYEDGSPCAFDDPDCWARGIVDYLRIKNSVALSLDHKTGRRKEGSKQLMMSAALILAHFPQLEKVICGYAWLQEGGRISREQYERKDIERIWQSFYKDLQELAWSYETGNWPTRPSGLCSKWCPVLDCVHNGRKRR
jgi:hypothetical protein